MSQLDSETTTIDGHTFAVFKLPPLDAQDTLLDIIHALAPAAGDIAGVYESGATEDLLDADLSSPQIGSAISNLAQGLTKERMWELVGTLMGVTHCDGTPLKKTF